MDIVMIQTNSTTLECLKMRIFILGLIFEVEKQLHVK